MRFPFDNTYVRLPERFYARVTPTPVRAPRLLQLNHALADTLGLESAALDSDEGAAIFSGNTVPDGADPIALAYAGHQFGSLVPRLGDGRAILLGEIVGTDGVRRDVQLKGSGRTPFSRGGDGRAALGPVLREYLVSETMAALGVPTTRALAAVSTGEPVMRERPLPGAIITRVAASHLRVGTFEYVSLHGDRSDLLALTRYALARHYPDSAQTQEPALALLENVIEVQVRLVAKWMGVGFIHGVMNTDNTSISGETIDFGPCAFVDEYHPDKTFSSIDRGGRYSFANQGPIAQWNMARLAEALLPLIADREEDAVRLAMERLEQFPARFEREHTRVLRKKLGLLHDEPNDLVLASRLLALMARDGVDYTRCFRALCIASSGVEHDEPVEAMFADRQPIGAWLGDWHARLARDPADDAERQRTMSLANPALIPRNHRIEQAITSATLGDLAPFLRLLTALSQPCEDQPAYADLAEAPRAEERVLATFCGT